MLLKAFALQARIRNNAQGFSVHHSEQACEQHEIATFNIAAQMSIQTLQI